MGKLEQLDKKTEEKGSGFVTVWQFIKFTFASLIAMISEFAILNIMNHIDAITNLNMQPFDWFVFHYKGDGVEGLGTMIAFLVSTTVAQIISFVVNRKKTFGSNMNLTFSVVVYFVVIVALICAQTYFAPQISYLLQNSANMGYDLATNIAKMCFSFLNFVVLFPLEKFVIMRKVENKEEAQEK